MRIAQPQTTRNAKPMAKARINESKTSVVSVPKHQQKSKTNKTAAGEAIEISSDESDNDEGVDEEDPMDEDEPEAAVEEPKTNGHAATNGTTASASKDDDDNESNDDDEDHEPTFGDLVREHETVDVTAALQSQLNPDANTDATSAATNGTKSAVAAPTLASLGHLLNAALRSGDDANLEVCFNTTTDAVWVRNTIQRLDPSLAGALLQKLAARIHRRPGRAHTLVGWVQWTLITHGGALLANQAGVTRALQELHRVLEERARGLNSLLLLKGKLDMLEAQMQLRRIQRAGLPSSSSQNNGGHSGVATVGGRSGSSKALDTVNTLTSRRGAGGRRRNGLGGRGARGGEDNDEEEFVATYREEDEEDVAGQILVNGAGLAGESFIADSDEEALDEDDDEDSEGDEDDDAEDDDDLQEMDEDDAAEEDEIDFDDVDEEDDDDDEDDEDDAAAAPPPKLQKKLGGAFSKRR